MSLTSVELGDAMAVSSERSPSTAAAGGTSDRVLVTGGAGHVGSHLVDALCDAGHDVSVLDDLSSGSRCNLDKRIAAGQVRFVEGSILDLDLVDREVARVPIVYHLAAAVGVPRIVGDVLGSLRTNLHGSENVLAACWRHDCKVLMASSSEVYGKSPTGVMSEDDDRVLGPTTSSRWSYSMAKAIDEQMTLAYTEKGLRAAIVRYFNSYGPRSNEREQASVVGSLIRSAIDQQPLTVHGDGSQQRCFTYVTDIVRGTMLAATEPSAEGRIFNIGSAVETSILELAAMVIRATGSSSTVELVAYGDRFGASFEDVTRRIPDLTRTSEVLGWHLEVPLDAGLQRTIDWTRTHARIR
jgi:UDP-glucose 4-epimerase